MKTLKNLLIALTTTGLLSALPAAQAADLKQLAEQLVNKKESPGQDPHAIREGGRTVGAGQIQRTGRNPQTGKARIAVQREGANVKKEKGVEDVE